jgi:glycosyltransferase involved in cell wall biosynthesis
VDVKVLLVAPYPPARDGIASYAAEAAADLRRRGERVKVVSPGPSAAHHHADLGKAWGVVKLLMLSRRADRTVVHFYPDLFFRGRRRVRFVLHWPWVAGALSLGRNVELVVHEAPYRDLRRARGFRGWAAKKLWRGLLSAPEATYVHTEWERREMAASLGLARERIGLRDHNQAFVRRSRLDRAAARRELGIAEREFCFLCIGFLQHHKGFDRALKAFARIPGEHLRLDVVGAARMAGPEVENYVAELRALVRSTPRARLHEGYASDHAFDCWLSACDVVVLPYREIWSSGVLARAQLYGRQVIVSDVGGLPDQAGPLAMVVGDDEELHRAMAEVADVLPAGQEAPRPASPRSRAEEIPTAAQPARDSSPNGAPLLPARRRRRSQGLT